MRPDDTPTKVCTKCGRLLPVESFNRDRQKKDGRCSWCKECQAEAARLYRRTHPETEAQRQRKRLYRRTHPEAAREYNRLWREAHRVELAEAQRSWREANPEYGRRYREANRAKYAAHQGRYRAAHPEAQRLWREANPEKAAAIYRNRRARQLAALGAHTAADVANQRTRQGGKCFWCGEKTGRHYHVDHVVPLALGGSNGPENIVIACPSCNQRKHAKHPMDFAGVLL